MNQISPTKVLSEIEIFPIRSIYDGMSVPQSIDWACHAVFLRCRDFSMKPEQRTRQEKIDIQLGRAGWLVGIRRLIRPGWAGHYVDFGRLFRIPEWDSPGAGTSKTRILARVVQETSSLAA